MHTAHWVPVGLLCLVAACSASRPGEPDRAATAAERPRHAVGTAPAAAPEALTDPSTARAAPEPTSGNATMTGSSQASLRCTAAQFVACHSGEQCARRGSEFLEAKRCFDHAADACAVAACEHGCDVYGTEIGGPKMVLCAPKASSTGNMRICGGEANWQCPEAMTCQVPPESARVLDAQGRCVPST